MIIYKTKYKKITAEKDFNGLFSVFEYTKKIFGNSYEGKKLLDSLTLKQARQFKNELLENQKKRALAFYEKEGFIDIGRFCSFFDGFRLSLHQKIDLYLKTFSK